MLLEKCIVKVVRTENELDKSSKTWQELESALVLSIVNKLTDKQPQNNKPH